MMKKQHIPHLCLVVILFLLSCGSGNKKGTKFKNTKSEKQQSVMVFAAGSLNDVFSEIIDSFEIQYNVKIQTNIASSGTLARQIEQGGEADVYISASKRWADYVDSLGHFLPGSKASIAKNQLVVIAPLKSPLKVATIDSTFNFGPLLGKDRLSMGDPAHVPAGSYTKQVFEYYGWFDELKEKTLPARDVRTALMVVEMEEAPLGVVFKTDAQKSQKVKILNTFPETSHKPIVYTGGVCKDNITAKKFFEYVKSNTAKAIWTKNGFSLDY